jgi:hypothetical protein
MAYVDPPDCPDGMTLREWRAAQTERPARRTRVGRLLGRRRRTRRR